MYLITFSVLYFCTSNPNIPMVFETEAVKFVIALFLASLMRSIHSTENGQ